MQTGFTNLAMSALDLYAHSPESHEGAAAFAEKRDPDFSSFDNATEPPPEQRITVDFAITPETQGLLDTAATFEDRLISEARDREAAGSIGAELTQEMGRAGLIAPELSTHLGGQGQRR